MSTRWWREFLLATLLNASTAVWAAQVLDQQQTIIDDEGWTVSIGDGFHQKLAQVVTAGISGLLTAVRFPVSCGTQPGLIIEIQGVTAGVPNGTVLTTQTISAASLPPFTNQSPPEFRTLALSVPVFFATGSQFAIVLKSTGDCSVTPGPVGDSYLPGNVFFSTLPDQPDWICVCEFAGDRWDLPFQTLVTLPNATTLPALISFTGDTVGSPPMVSGPNQPTGVISSGVNVEVQPLALGIVTKPVVLRGAGWYDYGSVSYEFPDVDHYRVEATISVDRLFDGFLLQTVGRHALQARLVVLSDGNIYAETDSTTNRPLLGTYGSNQPFRVRIDIDVAAQTWAFTLDPEMNGFADNAAIEGLAFLNWPISASGGIVFASLDIFPTTQSASGAVAAYDDILVQALPVLTDAIALQPFDPGGPGAFSNFYPDQSPRQQMAGSFQFSGVTVVDSISWFGRYSGTASVANPVAFAIRFFADSGGIPAALPFEEFDVMVDAQATGLTHDGAPWLSYSSPVALTLSPGTHWVSVVASPQVPPVGDSEWLWGQSDRPGIRAYRTADGTSWTPTAPLTMAFALSGTAATLDIDQSTPSTKFDALTDGLLIIRYLFGLTGASLTNNALGSKATQTDPTAITSYLDDIRPALDVDGSGTSDALTDGLLIIRYLFGLRGPALIAGAVDPLATRKTAAEIGAYIQSLMP